MQRLLQFLGLSNASTEPYGPHPFVNPPCTLTDMPTELLFEISSHLQRHDINALLCVSRRLASIMTPVLGRLGAAAVDSRASRRSLLHWAAGNGRTGLLRLVICHGADMHTSDSSGNTAIHSAVLRGQPATVSVLLENGAEAQNTNEDGWSPLHLAAIMGNQEIVGLLLDHGVDVNARSRALYCKTALHYAALQCHCRVADAAWSQVGHEGSYWDDGRGEGHSGRSKGGCGDDIWCGVRKEDRAGHGESPAAI